MKKKVAILQSNYIPWKGYFDIIGSVDEFIIYDDVQFTKNDWRNRNYIKTPNGVEWLTIPVGTGIHRRIRDVRLIDQHWQVKHWKSIALNYKKAPFFDEISALISPLYLDVKFESLTEVNITFINAICNYLGITTKITKSWDYFLEEGKIERLLSLCIQAKCTEYISGPAAKNYLDERIFKESEIDITWFDYSNYIEYPQLWGDFNHAVTILDLLFNCGKDASNFMHYGEKK